MLHVKVFHIIDHSTYNQAAIPAEDTEQCRIYVTHACFCGHRLERIILDRVRRITVFAHIDEEVMDICCLVDDTHLCNLCFQHLGSLVNGFKVIVIPLIDPPAFSPSLKT